MVYRVSIHDFCAQGLRAELRPGGWLDKRYELKGVISREELRHQLALATANAISSPTLDDSPATRAGEGSTAAAAVSPLPPRQEQADAAAVAA